METRSWPEMAAWYDAKLGDEGDFWHHALLDPALFTAVGEACGLRVLDVPCGNGHNTRRLARMGAEVTGVDYSAPIIARDQEREAEEQLGISYHVADAAHMDMLGDASFDLVVCQMGLMDIPDAEGAICEMGRVLRPGGRLVALFSHPCFDVVESSAWVEETMPPARTVWRKVRNYAEPHTGHFYWQVDGKVVSTVAYHRPLSWYVGALRSAGLVVTALEEPAPTEEFIAGEPFWGLKMADVPLHMLIEARKIEIE